MLYSWFNSIIKGYLKYRYGRIRDMQHNAVRLQEKVFQELTEYLSQTEYGRKHGIRQGMNARQYASSLPVVKYEDIFPYIDRMMHGEENILWPGVVQCFAKSSGTTNDRSKYIPFTEEILHENHVNASWDAMAVLYANNPDARIFDKKNLLMGGSLSRFADNPEVLTGDVSALLLSKMPAVGRPFYTPDFETALLQDWEIKIERMATICSREDITMFGGVPTWLIVLFERILELTGKENLLQVWPNVKTYFHGGVGFEPYRQTFHHFFPSAHFEYYEVYNASEGYFAVQDRLGEDGMLLLTDNLCYFEFIDFDTYESGGTECMGIADLEEHRDYVMVISNASGLWRYIPGDVIKVLSVRPLRIKVSGRTKQYINAFGEEVMVANTDKALAETCRLTGAEVRDYTVAPVYMESHGKGRHQWLVEFIALPQSIRSFEETLDQQLRVINSDYDAKRTKDLALTNLSVMPVAEGTFRAWLASKGKLGGQHKVPRLCNTRKYMDEILEFLAVRQ